ncbi:MAG: amidase family protein [Pseudomonadota bacterium]
MTTADDETAYETFSMTLNRRRLLQTSAATLLAAASAARPAFGDRSPQGANIAFATAAEALAALKTREVSARELTELCLQRITASQDTVNALALLRGDQALAEAAAIDEARAKGHPLGPLAGLPITIKESFDVSGLATTWGNPNFPKTPASENSAVAERLIAAGGILLGKTNVSLMLSDWDGRNPVYGSTRNPWNLDRVPGGSSAGAAAALSSGLSFLDIGSDLGGSIRQPAANCGIYGHKPTAGVVPQRGHVPSAAPPGLRAAMMETPQFSDLPVSGPMARSAPDLLTALSVVGGPDGAATRALSYRVPPARHKALRDFRVGFALSHPDAEPDTDTLAVLGTLIESLTGRVARLEEGWPEGVDPRRQRDLRHYFRATIGTLMATPEQAAEHARDAASDGPEWVQGDYYGAFNQGFSDRRAAFVAKETERLALRAAWQRYFTEFDVFLMPVQTRTAMAPDALTDEIAFASHLWFAAATVTGLPATAAPAGLAPNGLPVGLQILGPHYEDATCIGFAEVLARDGIGGYQKPPFAI